MPKATDSHSSAGHPESQGDCKKVTLKIRNEGYEVQTLKSSKRIS
jgi:hypothetical protein